MSRAEQRGVRRARVWLPLRVEPEGGRPLVGVTSDVSPKGVLVLARHGVVVGSRVTVTLDVPTEPGRALTFRGRVVHESQNTVDPDGLWRHRFGVELDEASDELRDVIEGLLQRGPLSSRG